MVHLETLNLKNSSNLKKLDIYRKMVLDNICFKRCTGLLSVTNMVALIKTLNFLDIKCCNNLKNIEDGEYLETFLIKINLTSFVNFYKIWQVLENLKVLEVLLLSNCI